MTISTENSSIIVSCNGSQTAFQYNFIADQASDISVSSIASTGSITPLTTGYTVSVNAAAPNQLWGVGGSVTFSVAPAAGTSLLIQRTLPLTQSTSIQNQGNIYPQVIETAMDTLEMQLQQIAGRTTQFQGIWTTATTYTVGDIVQDGMNGAGTLNYYICQVGNTSGVWATDLANGDWAISVLATVPTSNQPITLSGVVTGTGSQSIITSFSNGAVTNAALASGAVSLSKLANIGPNSVIANSSASSGTPGTVALTSNTLLGVGSSGNIAALTATSPITVGASSIGLAPSNAYQGSVTNPSATTSTTTVMAGLAGAITPRTTGNIFVTIPGQLQNVNGNVTVSVQGFYGTGTAPSNGAAQTGTAFGGVMAPIAANSGAKALTFTCIGMISALSTNVTYWLDVGFSANNSGTATLTQVSISAFEIK